MFVRLKSGRIINTAHIALIGKYFLSHIANGEFCDALYMTTNVNGIDIKHENCILIEKDDVENILSAIEKSVRLL